MAEPRLSPVETLKEQSDYLRGTIAQELQDDSECFSKGSSQLLKHHGSYQQDNRDERAAARKAGDSGKTHSMMVRTKVPGGKLTSRQLLAELDLCDELGNTTLRFTSRQALQLHGILKGNLRETIHRINQVQLTTLAACGDVVRNVMGCPAPYSDPLHQQVQGLVEALSQHFAPRTPAYHELWLQDPGTGERELVGGRTEDEIEPIYGKTYLPRKFKIAVGFASDNCVDIYTHDLGFLAVVRDGEIVGYNVLAGGGMGVTPSNKATFPALAKRLAFVTPSQVFDVAGAVVQGQRDFGNRADRKLARLKYLIHNWGLEKFKAQVEEYYGAALPAPQPDDVTGFNDHLGWDDQGDGKCFYGLNIENGRIQDNEQIQLKSALREICRSFAPGIRLTSHQSILLTDLDPAAKSELEQVLRSHRVRLSEETSTVRRWSMACVALPTCGLAITDSERALPGIIDQLEVELARLGLSNEPFTVRMTGCPNGCVRPYNSDVGLVGKAVGRYTLFLGGRLIGDRLNFVYKDLVPAAEIVPTLVPLMVYFRQARSAGESFGDFCHRKGKDDLTAWAEQYEAGPQ
ncbi:MAG: NADPH-dependent assimilatory sulfite reductase hemoprotein subunit [Pirellulaceae bacterium]|nr:NADPH-dependent assimilatory sulfite reductase hemoprotein subunit [Pirellulaceae bacterium]